jgi:hypothetical protein
MGLKISEDQRPSSSSISKRLNDRISRKIQNLFVQDIQNDCCCDIERYDTNTDVKNYSIYLSETDIKSSLNGSKTLCLPMLNNISEKNIFHLLEEAGNQSDGNVLSDNVSINLFPRFVIYNPDSNIENVIYTYREYTNLNSFQDDSVAVKFVPKHQVWFTPDPEFFGCISVNIDKFGVFCIPNRIYKKELLK